MATKGGKLVAASLRDSADNDPDVENRKKAVFAMSRLPDGQATAQFVELAQSSKYPEVRKQAVFWLGQSKDPKALDYLTKLISAPHSLTSTKQKQMLQSPLLSSRRDLHLPSVIHFGNIIAAITYPLLTHIMTRNNSRTLAKVSPSVCPSACVQQQ